MRWVNVSPTIQVPEFERGDPPTITIRTEKRDEYACGMRWALAQRPLTVRVRCGEEILWQEKADPDAIAR